MQDLPQGPGAERNPNGTIANQPGVYELKTSGGVKRIITSPGDVKLNEGGVHADALVRLGFKWVAPVPSRQELLEMQKAQLAKDAAPAAKPEVKS